MRVDVSPSIVRFRGRVLSVTIKRPAETIPAGLVAALLAREDAEAVSARVAEHCGVPSAPTLR
ncbi:hypothetical protein CMS2309 [Clavibacter sepedonicus]|uniref:Uncharacterized protein n=1 Tax=Clavibacter sepedonicus TaxID=31964 RepID=B0RGJ0_CLASE|nr:hypothetical protein CMS2309 [Clavibacter sepedonicus]